jgi:6-phosphogluconolactonase
MINHHIFDNAATLYKNAADYIVYLSDKAIKKKNKFSIALSGGNTPRKLYELLSQAPYLTSIDWKNIFVFWSDERCVPLADEQNNSHMAFAAMLNKVPIPSQNIFPIPVNLQPALAANAYEQILKDFFNDDRPAFDLILLGLGDNGHTASLFPFTSILKEKKHIVKEVYVEELKAYRISFTSSLINNASHILFLVSGKEKSAIIKTIFSETIDPEKYPVQSITSANITWYLDKDAASQLK